MRGVSPFWRSFVLVAALSLIAPAVFAQDLLESRIGNPPGVAAEGRIGWPPGDEEEAQGTLSIPPGSPAAEGQSLWTRLMTWVLWFG